MSGAEIYSFDAGQLRTMAPAFAVVSTLPGLPHHPITNEPAGPQSVDLNNASAAFKPNTFQLNKAAQAQRQLSNMPHSRMSRDYSRLRTDHAAALRRPMSAPTAPRAPSILHGDNIERMQKAQINPRTISKYAQGIKSPVGGPKPPGEGAAKAPALQPQIAPVKTISLGNDNPLLRGTRAALRLASIGMSPVGMSAAAVSIAEEAVTFMATMPPAAGQTLKPASVFNQYAAIRPSIQPANSYKKLLAPAA